MESLNADENAASGEGIEANDLAGLLTRFEEATNAVDDIAIPSASHKSKRSLLLKAKSAGNSPAVTPPATPPPLGPRQNVCFKPQPAKRQKSLLANPQTHKPIQFRLVVPPSVVQTKVTVASAITANPSTVLSSQIPSQSTALIVTPKVILQNTQATNFTVHKPQKVQASSTVLIKPGPLPLQATPNLASLPLLLKPVSAAPPQPPISNLAAAARIVSTAEVLGNSILVPASAPSALSSRVGHSAQKTVNVLSMPIVDAGAPPVAKKVSKKQTIPKPKSTTPSVKNKVVVLPGSSKTKVVISNSPPVVSHAPSPVPQSSKAPVKVSDSTAGGTPLLQSMLQNHCTSLMSAKLTSTSILSKNKLPLAPKTSLEAETRLSKGVVTVTPTQGPSAGGKETSSSKSNVRIGPTLPSSKAVKGSREDKNSAAVQRITPVQTKNQSDIMPPTSTSGGPQEKNSVGEHAYCSSATSRHLPVKSDSDISNSVPTIEMSSDVTAARGSDVDSGFVSSLESEIGSENSVEMLPGSSELVNEFVFEEGEIQVDDDGNDAIDPRICSSAVAESTSSDDCSFRAVSFGKRRAPYSGQRGRQYRRRAELSNSPIREDTSNFFDKIPSHYTVLSIPTKPTKTTAFESATKAIGSTDHLELLNIPEVSVDDGHYDKVPSHRSIFTNTTKDLNVHSEEEDVAAQSLEKEEEQSSRSHHSSSQRSHRSRSSHRSCRSGSRNSSRGRSLDSASRSPDSRRWRSRSRSWRRRRSSSRFSSCSSMSSSSSVSYCSTCGGSMSRSRSRSYSSSDRSVSRSRSRSRSPGRERDRQMRRRRRLRSFSPHGRGFRSRSPCSFSHSRSRSRSYSPERLRARAMRYGRSRRHRTKSRSSHERKLMERRKEREEEKIKAMEERRVVYVGKIPEGYTKFQLRKRFERFGDIKAVKINFREHGDNYGFVTFNYACDAIAAKEKGNNIPGEQRFDLCFGGRRHFCPDQYADLDGNREIEEEYAPMPKKMTEEFDYAALLKQHQSQQKKKR